MNTSSLHRIVFALGDIEINNIQMVNVQDGLNSNLVSWSIRYDLYFMAYENLYFDRALVLPLTILS